MLRYIAVFCFLCCCGANAFVIDSPCIKADGKPFFPIGIYDYPGGDDLNKANMKEMADAGINTIHWILNNKKDSWPFQKRDFNIRDLDNAEKLGLKVITALNSVAPWTEAEAKKNWGSDLNQFKAGSPLHKKLLAIKDHPALLMYETMDEPAGCRVMDDREIWPALDVLRKCYDFMKSVDSVHPIWCNEVAWFWCKDRISMDVFREWSTICDVYSQDDYPVAYPPYPYIPMFVIAEDMDAMHQIVDADNAEPFIPVKPLMMIIQGQGRNMCAIDRPEIHQRNPNKIENRFAAYTSIIHGAKGILWWGSRDLVPLRDEKSRLTDNGFFWEIIKQTASELDVLKDALVNGRQRPEFKLSSKDLDAALFTDDRHNYLIVSNKSADTVIDAEISVLNSKWRVSDKRIMDVLFEKRSIKMSDSAIAWADSFAPWDVHVYIDEGIN